MMYMYIVQVHTFYEYRLSRCTHQRVSTHVHIALLLTHVFFALQLFMCMFGRVRVAWDGFIVPLLYVRWCLVT